MTTLRGLPLEQVGYGILDIADSKYVAFMREGSTDEERLRMCVQYWLLRDPYASWRRIIWRLYYYRNHAIADTIRSYAEKSTGEDSIRLAPYSVSNGTGLHGKLCTLSNFVHVG